MDLWASDSDSSIGHLASTTKSADYYRKLYLTEVNKRKELEQIIDKQDQEIRELKTQLENAQLKLKHKKDSEFGEILGDLSLQEPEEGYDFVPQDAQPAVSSVNVSHPMDARWIELAQAEKERKSKARRNLKGKSLRLPLSAAAHQAQQHRAEGNNNSHSLTGSHNAAVDDTQSVFEASNTQPVDVGHNVHANDVQLPQHTSDPSLIVDSATFDDEDDLQVEKSKFVEPTAAAQLGLGATLSAEEKQRIRSMRKRNVRHGNDAQMRRLNVKLQQKDSEAKGSKRSVGDAVGRAATETSLPNRSQDAIIGNVTSSSLHHHDIHFSSDDSGWDSGEELFPSSGGAVSAHASSSTPPPIADAASMDAPVHRSSAQATRQTNSDRIDQIDEAAVDSILISWARGKSLPVLLTSLQEVSPPQSMPVVALDLQDCSVGDIRKTYL
eukprot:gene35049-42447_t